MELSELKEEVLRIFETSSVEGLTEKIMKSVLSDDVNNYRKFKESVEDLSTDWLQMIFQYYLADRKEKMQDYTPKTLAKLMGELSIKKSKGKIVDMCAGSGALTIQTWSLNNGIEFECIEFDESVLPILLFNLAIRNIKATVYHKDVLQGETISVYKVIKRNEFGKVEKIT